MKEQKNFFQALHHKILRKPDRHFDQIFWAKFENEFGAKKEALSMWETLASYLRPPVLVPIAAGVLVVIGYFQLDRHNLEPGAFPEASVAVEIMEDPELYREVDLLDVELADADWEILTESSEGQEGEGA